MNYEESETFGLKSTNPYLQGNKLFCEKSVVIKLNSGVLKPRSFANLKYNFLKG